MPINLFGFTIGKQENDESGANDVVAPDSYDGSYTLDSGSVYGGFMSTYTDFSGGAKTEEEFNLSHFCPPELQVFSVFIFFMFLRKPSILTVPHSICVIFDMGNITKRHYLCLQSFYLLVKYIYANICVCQIFKVILSSEPRK